MIHDFDRLQSALHENAAAIREMAGADSMKIVVLQLQLLAEDALLTLAGAKADDVPRVQAQYAQLRALEHLLRGEDGATGAT